MTRLIHLIDSIRFLLLVLRAYRLSLQTGNPQYVAMLHPTGIPKATILLATGREAWRVSQYAIETCEMEKGELYD